MVGRTPGKRAPSVLDVTKQLITPPLQPLPSTSPTPTHAMADECTTRLCGFNDRIASTVNLEQVDVIIRRYLSSGQYKTALFWADKRLALAGKKKRPPSLVDVAEFIKVLSAVGDYTRLIAYSQKHELALKHVFFAYFYVNALFQKKYFFEILKLKLATLKGFNDPTESAAPCMAYIHKMKSFLPNEEENRALDKISSELKLDAALLLLLGKTYLISQNRHAARLCLQSAVRRDPCAVEAMDVIHKYNLIPKRNFYELIERFPSLDCGIPNALLHFSIMDGRKDNADKADNPAADDLSGDFSVRTAKAIQYYRIGAVYQANEISTQILKDAGMFQDCILVHVATLVQLRKSDELFMLAHRLVDNQPDDEISWYTVGCYYYTIGQLGTAKNFLNKCTTMNSSFGEGWLAFGHVLSAESEHEQAMNCFLKASRILEGSFEPLMYVGLEYSYANSTKLAQDFLSDAAINAGENPLVLHEQGCIFYMKKDWKSAEEHFSRALRLAYGISGQECDLVEILWTPLSEFWEPLVNNLGHVKRKLGKYLEAVKFHQRAIMMCPKKATTIGAMAVAYASAGLVDQATVHFQEALCISPHDQVLKHGLEKLLECLETNACLSTFQVAETPQWDARKLDVTEKEFVVTAEEKKAQEKALETLRRYKIKRRPDITALRCRNAPHATRQHTVMVESSIAEVSDDADIEMTIG
uniref:Cell division cycle protein 16 n=1 Tax=Parascaris univalens TaxID=6257 RepID=A0A915APB9_PARUN